VRAITADVTLLHACEQDGNIDMEEWKTAIAKNAAIKSLINPSRSVYAIQETVDREAQE
jgi:hypothetical protein